MKHLSGAAAVLFLIPALLLIAVGSLGVILIALLFGTVRVTRR